MSGVCAIVPVRSGGVGKSRLAGVLSPQRRERLIETMLGEVLAALRGARGIDAIVVVSPDLEQAPAGTTLLRDGGEGLNAAVSLALASFGSRFAAALVVAADVPRVTAAEIETLLQACRDADVGLAPDRRHEGTNALWLRLPPRIAPNFGGASFARHCDAARRAGVRLCIVDLPGLSHDVDLPADLPSGALSRDAVLALADESDLGSMMSAAAALATEGFGRRVSYSRKVFIPLTQLCRDVCHYCTFAAPPRPGTAAYLRPEQVLEIARAGAAAGCHEALFTLGDKPELRYARVRSELATLGFVTTLDYLEHCARLVHEQTGLLPHLNPGVMDAADLRRLRRVAVSMGLMLETASERLAQKGGPHHRSPDKHPAARLATLRAAGVERVPFTTGLLIGIGETRRERLEALLAIRDLHDEFGHVQDLIIQNFRAKPRTRMAGAPEPALEELLWTIAAARLAFGPSMSIQAPPNLSAPESLPRLIEAGINDWGGVSPVTPDHVNPEAPWPEVAALEQGTRAAGRWLVERLAIVPQHAAQPERWLDPGFHTTVRRRVDATGYVREPAWVSGAGSPPLRRYVELVERPRRAAPRGRDRLQVALERALRGERLDEPEVARLFEADGEDFARVVAAADALRARRCGPAITYVVNRNINYTNICSYSCGFCAFAKGRGARSLRGPGYLLDSGEIERRVAEARERGATEVCMQGGIHPSFTGETYLAIVRAAQRAAPGIHVHAFSPLEIAHGAASLDLPLEDYLARLRDAGLRTLPGTAAEILSDDVRAVICPDKVDTQQWLAVMRAAHRVGLRSTATIMFGHVETPRHWARHLLLLRDLQDETGGFTEFVPLPYVHMEAPLWRKGLTRSGPSFREAILMHAVGRLVLHPSIPNVQASWVKLGRDGALVALRAGANDFGGVLMDESITRAAGGVNGQELDATAMQAAIRSIGRMPRERTTLYGEAPVRASAQLRQHLAADDLQGVHRIVV
ncbi:MAG: 5-amino-6-(D-ribitylamino)uracil--L-tyrosine 4-hydroxyphenyl transferase CofH [Gammaproteobacteria bacterium]|nr:5-amino-6-(D-ribitylamino)uracil--L-tyrosine 4-hydroxyphenyl transferase CofH [Gammaproteobacteria bacterium]